MLQSGLFVEGLLCQKRRASVHTLKVQQMRCLFFQLCFPCAAFFEKVFLRKSFVFKHPNKRIKSISNGSRTMVGNVSLSFSILKIVLMTAKGGMPSMVSNTICFKDI